MVALEWGIAFGSAGWVDGDALVAFAPEALAAGASAVPTRLVNSAAARASVTARVSLPFRSAASAARLSHRSASRKSPFFCSARAVWSETITSSESEGSGAGSNGMMLEVSLRAGATMITPL